jgi:hypothetical protein
MEFEEFKAEWQKRPAEGSLLELPATASRSLRMVRTGTIRDLQRSDELSWFVFYLLFALVAIGVSFMIMPPGAARIAAWLFAAALLVDGISGIILLGRRFRGPATATMLEYISKEYRQVETRIRFERYSKWIMVLLAAVALLLLVFNPRPVEPRANAFDALGRVAVVTAFLALAWRKAKLRSVEIQRELERYLQDLKK